MGSIDPCTASYDQFAGGVSADTGTPLDPSRETVR